MKFGLALNSIFMLIRGFGFIAMTDTTKRFSDRVDDYVKYRPHYPEEAIDWIIDQTNLDSSSIVADIGSGTGILTYPFLQRGFFCYAVEPNKEMRTAAEQILQGLNFQSINGRAEHTTLQPDSIDLIVCGQAFHWFDLEKTRFEFQRILRPGGYVVLLWNERLTTTPFLAELETVVSHHSVDYDKVNHVTSAPKSKVLEFLGRETTKKVFLNVQELDMGG